MCVRWSRSRVRSIPVYRDKRWRGRGGRAEGKKERRTRVRDALSATRISNYLGRRSEEREKERERGERNRLGKAGV